MSTTTSAAPPILEGLTALYAGEEPEDVASFLEAHPSLVPLLIEARPVIDRYFPNAPVVLELVHEPDAEDEEDAADLTDLFATVQNRSLGKRRCLALVDSATTGGTRTFGAAMAACTSAGPTSSPFPRPAMPFDWADDHALAVTLGGRTGNEAAARSAISRAYYAALGRAAGFFRSEGTEISPLRVHGQASRAFTRSTDLRRGAIGERIALLHRQPNRADYEGTIAEALSAMARDAGERSAFVIRALDDLRSPPA